jgi:hypothetical protein
VSIRAALDLKRGGNRHFFICSLSSRCFLILNLFFTTNSMKVEKLKKIRESQLSSSLN